MRWAETLPDFLPTEEQFVALVTYYAQGPNGMADPIDCGTPDSRSEADAGVACVRDAIEAGRAFYFFYARFAWEQGLGRRALMSPGWGAPRRFTYSLDRGRTPPHSGIDSSACATPRFLFFGGPRPELQCGRWPTPYEFRAETRVGKDCGLHQPGHAVTEPKTRKEIACVMEALASREAFHYRFFIDWGGDHGLVSGALSWQPEAEAEPVLSFYRGGNEPEESERVLIRRACADPRIRVVAAAPEHRQYGDGSFIEVDCAAAEDGPR